VSASSEGLEGVAAEQHERAEPIGMAGRDELGDRAAGVAADEHDVVELERRQELVDHRGDTLHRQLGAGKHRLGVCPERQGRRDASRATRPQQLDQRLPQRTGHRVAVDKHDRAACGRPGGLIMDGSGVDRGNGRHRVLLKLELRTACT
jgi:hypothetical protein